MKTFIGGDPRKKDNQEENKKDNQEEKENK